MTLQKYPLTISSVWVNELSYIETSLRLVGCWEDSATTNARIAGLTQEATEKTTVLPSYVSAQ